jgi:glutamate transport system ATP-binding protein
MRDRNLVELRGIHKAFGDNVVLDGVDLNVARGEVIVIAGPSGSGKSTMLRCVNGLETVDAGEVRFDGQPVTSGKGLPALRAQIGFVFQQFHLFPHMTVLQNLIEAPIGIRGMARDEATRRAEALLVDIGLAEKALSYPSSLSGGQQQRVAIARALMMEPEVLLFDEPTSALDPVTTAEVLSLIRQLSTGARTTIIVTHEIEFARHVSTHVAFMRDGLVEEYRPTGEFFASPRSAATRAFLSQFAAPTGERHAGL